MEVDNESKRDSGLFVFECSDALHVVYATCHGESGAFMSYAAWKTFVEPRQHPPMLQQRFTQGIKVILFGQRNMLKEREFVFICIYTFEMKPTKLSLK